MRNAERVTLNPVGEDATKAPLDLVGLDASWGIYLLAHDYTPPPLETEHADNPDGDGSGVVKSRWGNRTITERLRLVEPPDPAATNLIRNPSIELSSEGWLLNAASFTGTSLVREAKPVDLAFARNAGDYALRAKGTKDNTATERFLIVGSTNGVNGFPVVAGTVYSAQCEVYVVDPPTLAVPGPNFRLRLEWFTAAGAFIGLSDSAQVLLGAGLSDLTLTVAAPALAAFASISVLGKTNVALDTVDYWVDAWQLEAAAAPTAYFDGDTPGCTFSGARHASTSARPAPGGPRYNAIVRDVVEQIDRIKRQKVGTLRRIAPEANPLTYDLLAASIPEAPQDMGVGMQRSEITLSFEAKPGGRAPEELVATKEELTLPVLSMLAENVKGDMPGLGRLRLTDLQNVSQFAAWWGLQQRYYDAAVTADVFYQAEGRTLLGGAATAALANASGAGNNTVLHNALVNKYQGVLSTQASGGGAHLSNVGTYRVLARLLRPLTNTGDVTVKFAWSESDFVRVNENPEVAFSADTGEGIWQVADLGTVTLEKVPAGSTQRWEGRILAKSSVANDDLYVDWLWLVPTDEGSGEVIADDSLPDASSYLGFDPFDQIAGALAGKPASVGGLWAGAGDVDDYQVEAVSHTLRRTAVGDVLNTPRYAFLPTNYTDIAAAVDLSTSNPEAAEERFGVLARYVDANNWIAAYLSLVKTSGIRAYWKVSVRKRVAGAFTILGSSSTYVAESNFGVTVSGTPELVVTSFGLWQLRWNGVLYGMGIDTDLATGGALQTGKVGLFDEYTSAAANTRIYDNFRAWAPAVDQAVYAGRSLEISNERARREDSAGLAWGKARYEGNYILVPPAGPEKAISRVTAKLSRHPDTDTGIDDVKAQLWVTPLYLLGPPT